MITQLFIWNDSSPQKSLEDLAITANQSSERLILPSLFPSLPSEFHFLKGHNEEWTQSIKMEPLHLAHIDGGSSAKIHRP